MREVDPGGGFDLAYMGDGFISMGDARPELFSADIRDDQIMNEFSTSDGPMVLLAPLTLRVYGANAHPESCRVIVLDQPINLPTSLQAIDRLHRFGQTAEPRCARYPVRNTYMAIAQKRILDKAESLALVTAIRDRFDAVCDEVKFQIVPFPLRMLGIDLDKRCRTVIYLEQLFNVTTMKQAIDRVRRTTQTAMKIVYRYHMPGTHMSVVDGRLARNKVAFDLLLQSQRCGVPARHDERSAEALLSYQGSTLAPTTSVGESSAVFAERGVPASPSTVLGTCARQYFVQTVACGVRLSGQQDAEDVNKRSYRTWTFGTSELVSFYYGV
ncbi:hypothetical protein DOTSEDRAFT_24810 [Dothistroma septosporum NZE10]|uniref:Helicase C-terminal domain-containing protein n=1 Tax=Dothistroma septosporum (strain NZE10 / CBS 128990) TaxID=675120 RepID=M2YLA2_DOTSN|nr:hypothetical protein DOTSEDRAFT_24810 [Dothistroma septosporum NZE10]